MPRWVLVGKVGIFALYTLVLSKQLPYIGYCDILVSHSNVCLFTVKRLCGFFRVGAFLLPLQISNRHVTAACDFLKGFRPNGLSGFCVLDGCSGQPGLF